MRKLKNILVTGGAGFIGCNFIHYLMGESTAGGTAFTDSGFDGTIVNVDCLMLVTQKALKILNRSTAENAISLKRLIYVIDLKLNEF